MIAKALGTATLFGLGVLGVARTQPGLAATVHAVRDDDVYALPPPVHLHAATLGWDAAVVDLLWAKLLVEYGIHWSERRDFRDVPNYVDAILELEPDYAPVYKFVDTMLAYRPMQGTEDDVRRAREYLERGTRERANDPNVWLEYGQFLAFVGPSFLRDPFERDAWRKSGASAMGHAVELGADADRALTAASMLSRAGASDEAARYLERAYAFTEHPSMREVHEAIGRNLAALHANAIREDADAAARAFEARWHSELPFLSRSRYLLLGPVVDPARCSGLAAVRDPLCERDWKQLLSPDGSGDR
ncbi:MAG: hypothetical protein M3O50_18585 [Myxococcota bacterium]|nr:hypothetical protein [Myxococcota bacterium]